MLWLLTGNLTQGWPEYARAWRNRPVEQKAFTTPPWDGSSLSGRTILLHEEQGAGDTLQFIRYASLVKKYGGQVIFWGPASLLRLLASCPGVDRVASRDAGLPPFDVHASLLSLPGLLGTTLQTIPAAIPYLEACPEEVRTGGSNCATFAACAWASSGRGTPHTATTASAPSRWRRSSRWRVRGATAEPANGSRLGAARGSGKSLRGARRGRRLSGDWAETAAVLRNLDLLVSVDSAVAHCAGPWACRSGWRCRSCPTFAGSWTGRTPPGIRPCGSSVRTGRATGTACLQRSRPRCRRIIDDFIVILLEASGVQP